MSKHTINVNNNLLLLKLRTQYRNLFNAIETNQLGWKRRTKRLGLKQKQISHLPCTHTNKNITNGVLKNITNGLLLQKKSMGNVSLMEPYSPGMITTVLGTWIILTIASTAIASTATIAIIATITFTGQKSAGAALATAYRAVKAIKLPSTFNTGINDEGTVTTDITPD